MPATLNDVLTTLSGRWYGVLGGRVGGGSGVQCRGQRQLTDEQDDAESGAAEPDRGRAGMFEGVGPEEGADDATDAEGHAAGQAHVPAAQIDRCEIREDRADH